ncbi:MAG: hypothetical protein K8W52_38440 [Deltaproteobacteria bacterium]|nr:hypothetical protein [Deltaproteobacteria bacterium]
MRNLAVIAVLVSVAAPVHAEAPRRFPATTAPGWRFGAGGFLGLADGNGDGGSRSAVGAEGEALFGFSSSEVGNLALATRVRLEAGPWSYTEGAQHETGVVWTASASAGLKPCVLGVLCAEAALGGRLVREHGTEALLFAQGRLSAQVPFLARGGAELGVALDVQQRSQWGDEVEVFAFLHAFWR